MNRLFTTCLPALVAGAIAVAADAQSLYRYIDANGRIVYSDQPPPPTAKNVQPKQMTDNIIETDPVPFAAREAAEKNPVTLYTFDCEICKEAQALLAKRGVPYTTVVISEEEGMRKVKELTGKVSGPVLQVGEKQIAQGFNADRWEAMLDQAGYPKNIPPARRQTARAPAGGTPPAPSNAATQAAESDAAAPRTGPGTDYPK